jgi:hypothetical protein
MTEPRMAPSCSFVRGTDELVGAGGGGVNVVTGAGGRGVGMVEMVESAPSVTRAVIVVEARVMICVTTWTAGVTCWRGSRGWMIAIIYYFVSVKYLTRMIKRGVCLRMASRSISKMMVGECEGAGGAQQGAGWELSFWRGS